MASVSNAVLFSIKKMVLALYFLTLGGLLAELVLLDHFEGAYQKLPAILMGVGIVTILLYLFSSAIWAKRIFQVSMVLLVIVGAVGVWMHYNGNAEFELEMYPKMAGFEHFWESAKGATPMLAPGAITGLGLLGLIYAMFPSKTDSKVE